MRRQRREYKFLLKFLLKNKVELRGGLRGFTENLTGYPWISCSNNDTQQQKGEKTDY